MGNEDKWLLLYERALAALDSEPAKLSENVQWAIQDLKQVCERLFAEKEVLWRLVQKQTNDLVDLEAVMICREKEDGKG